MIGASFIGLEVAASLRARGIEVHVIAPETRPLERIMGAEIGDFIRNVHEEHGVTFHLGTIATAIDERDVTLSSGDVLPADLVVVGIGVRPETRWRSRLGSSPTVALRSTSTSRRAYLGSSRLATSHVGRIVSPALGSASSIGSSPNAKAKSPARNILGARERFDAVPFFWSQHYDMVISYVGHAERWDKIEIDGRVDARDCTVTYTRGGRKLAVVTIGRDLESLGAELELEKVNAA